MQPADILLPVFVMGILNVVMFVWMLATRIPAMAAAGIDNQDARDTSTLKGRLPLKVSQVADNYNHLFEQPTLFYAIAISIAVLGAVDSTHVACAWIFTGCRVLHSLVQATVNIVVVRFTFFAIAWISLAVMIVRATSALL